MQTSVTQLRLPGWLEAVVAAAGGPGLLLITFLDSSVLSFPVINDLLLMHLSIASPARMPYYAAMATLGSVCGCVLLYYLARKGGAGLFHKHAGARAQRIQHWLDRHGLLSIMVTGLMPPPTPFKVFVIGAGALGMPLRSFISGLTVARGVRFFGEALLAVRYGEQATQFFLTHKLLVSGTTLLAVLALYMLSRFAFARTLRGDSGAGR